VSIRSDPLDRLEVPDGTTVEEHDLVTEGDILVGGQSVVEFGVRGRNVVAGERVRFGGDIEAEGDCRLDMWCDVAGNVLVGEDAYLGERVHVAGQLMVSGDLDIGDDVDIEEGFEANGWIVIRNPMPTIVFLFVYLTQLLRLGEEEAAQEVMDEVLADREVEPLVVPRSARVADDAWQVSTPAVVGDGCRLHGNLRATRIEVGADNEIFGSLRGRGDVSVGTGTVIHGDVTTRSGAVSIAADAQIRGDISCGDLELHDDAEVEGAIRADGEVALVGNDETPDAATEAVTDEAETEETGTDEAATDSGGAGDDAADDDADETDGGTEDETATETDGEDAIDETTNGDADDPIPAIVEVDPAGDGAAEPDD